jgi:hypothetical protein
MRKTSFLVFIGARTALAQDPVHRNPGLLLSHSFTGSNQIEILIAVTAKPAPRSDLAASISESGIEVADLNVVNR